MSESNENQLPPEAASRSSAGLGEVEAALRPFSFDAIHEWLDGYRAEIAVTAHRGGIAHACKMLVRYMERENMDLLDLCATELIEIVRNETKRIVA